jgi:phospholipase C
MKQTFSFLNMRAVTAVASVALLSATFVGCKKDKGTTTPVNPGINKVNHVVVIYLENHSFDNLYGSFAGANGLSNATTANTTQLDLTGTPYTVLPAIPNSPAFPTNLANTYFNIDQYAANNVLTQDVLHRYYQEQMQIDGGKMDKYAAYNSNSAGLSQGYYKTSLLPMLPFAQKYVLCDNFYHSAFGGSFLNHQWLIAAASPTFPNAPTGIKAVLNADGTVLTDGAVTPDGFVVNTSYTVNAPHPATAIAANLVPNQTNPTIGDRLSDKNISWAWYSGGWNDALAGSPPAICLFCKIC